nr:glycosyltransferase 61 family protein [Lentibacter algarum]
MWRRDKLITAEPVFETPRSKLQGKWLWGGVLYHHFGHFQVESTARLWAVKRFRDEIEGVVFTPRDVKNGAEVLAYERDYLQLAVGDLPVKLLSASTEIEALVVPGQGFGLGRIAGGTRVFRRFIDQQFAQDVAPDGPEKLFISRSKQGLGQGGFVGEEVLDRRMHKAGYTVFWPEEHSIGEQVARYKAAQRVVALDGSALHLFAMVARRPQTVAVILRRERIASRSLRQHLHKFMGRKPLVIDALNDTSEAEHGKKRLISALDFDMIGKALKKHDFIEKMEPWGGLTASEVSAD